MRILERHILSSILKVFISTVLIFCFLYIVIEITSTLDEIIARDIPTDILIKYYLSFFPIIFVQTSSVACLISVLFTFSGLNNSNEITAMRASGLTFWKITKPALYFGILISGLIFWVNECHVPQATARTQQIRNENMILKVDRIRKRKEKIKNLTFYGLKNRLYFIDTFDPHSYELHGITIIEYTPQQTIKTKTAALKGIWTGLAWKFISCQITTYDPNGVRGPIKIKVYKEKLMDIAEGPKEFLEHRQKVSTMNLKQLKAYIDRFAHSGAVKAINNLMVDYHQKIAFPFGNFVIVLIGLPFSLMIKGRKGASFTAFGTAMAIGFLYYVINAVSLAFGKGGLLPPLLSAWATPILFTGIALIIIETDFAN